jgi:3',5'-cyclic AMP phosphodiesterase CpdA
VVLNGDLIHDKAELMAEIKNKVKGLTIPLYLTRGNHDQVTEAQWLQTWNQPLNYSFTKLNSSFILGDTSNEKGEYLMPNIEWMKEELNKYRNQKNIFIFLHIPQIPWVEHCIDSPQLIELFSKYPNIRAVFHGHIHTLDDLKTHQGIHYLFDSHIGGSWGTDYKGFRVIELMKDNTVLTYMMNPEVRIKEEWV